MIQSKFDVKGRQETGRSGKIKEDSGGRFGVYSNFPKGTVVLLCGLFVAEIVVVQ